MEAVQGHFNDTLGRPELLNRFGDNIIVFDFIKRSDSIQDYGGETSAVFDSISKRTSTQVGN